MKHLITILLLLISFDFFLFAKDYKFEINIQDSLGQPVEDAYISIKHPIWGSLIYEGFTNLAGNVSVSLPEGKYKFNIKHPDYNHINMNFVCNNKNRTINFPLKKCSNYGFLIGKINGLNHLEMLNEKYKKLIENGKINLYKIKYDFCFSEDYHLRSKMYELIYDSSGNYRIKLSPGAYKMEFFNIGARYEKTFEIENGDTIVSDLIIEKIPDIFYKYLDSHNGIDFKIDFFDRKDFDILYKLQFYPGIFLQNSTHEPF
jgi:hypothetical protein